MIEYLVYFIDFPPIQMAVVILMSASANARRREEEKKMLEEIKQHMPENMEIPSFLEDYYGISRELAQLGKELRGLHTGEEKKKLVADTMQKLIAQEKYRKEGDWGRDKSLARLPRSIDYPKGRLELLHDSNASELFALLQSNKDQLAPELRGHKLPDSIEATGSYIQYLNMLFQTNNGFSYGIKDRRGKLIGEISLSPAVKQRTPFSELGERKPQLSEEQYNNLTALLDRYALHRIYELGFWVGEEFKNQGHITAASKVLSDKAFDDRLFTEFVIINAKKTNEASIAVAKKLGFALEPQQFNNQSDMVTYSKSDRSEFRNFVRGKKLISDTRNP